MASKAYARIGGRGKSELRPVNVLRLSLCPGSSLISIQTRKSKRDRYWLYKKRGSISHPCPHRLRRGIRRNNTGGVKTASDSPRNNIGSNSQSVEANLSTSAPSVGMQRTPTKPV